MGCSKLSFSTIQWLLLIIMALSHQEKVVLNLFLKRTKVLRLLEKFPVKVITIKANQQTTSFATQSYSCLEVSVRCNTSFPKEARDRRRDWVYKIVYK